MEWVQQMDFSPTVSFYSQLQKAYDQFNGALFGGKLPPCLITLRSSNHTYGYHHSKRFVSPGGEFLDELGLHPGFFTLRPVEEVLSTLVHEMVHHWQGHFGAQTRSNPHNREWGQKMRQVGLIPSNTALPGGKTTGRTMSHYIDPQGPFIAACREVVGSGFKIEWLDRHAPRQERNAEEHHEKLKAAGVFVEVSAAPLMQLPVQADGASWVVMPAPKKEATRVRYTCVKCNVKAWAAPETSIFCGNCQHELLV
jgi:predicted SprT family Zn-dependent metalloprotease